MELAVMFGWALLLATSGLAIVFALGKLLTSISNRS